MGIMNEGVYGWGRGGWMEGRCSRVRCGVSGDDLQCPAVLAPSGGAHFSVGLAISSVGNLPRYYSVGCIIVGRT